MASTVTRRFLRRARLGGRHTYRAVKRHRITATIAAVVAAAAIGTSAVVAGDLPGNWDRSPVLGHQHSMPDGMPGRMDAHRN